MVTAEQVPRALRMRRARWGDLRLWGGVALLAACVAGGGWALGQEEATVTVWRAARDLSVGSAPSVQSGDLEPVQVSADVVGDRYAGPDAREWAGADARLRWPVAAGELVPRSALAPASAGGTRLVTVPVDPLHAPVGLLPGDIVDVWAMPRADAVAEGAAEPSLVLSAVAVAGVSDDALGIGGELAVVLDVPEDAPGRLVAAARGGTLDLVAVPVASQAASP